MLGAERDQFHGGPWAILLTGLLFTLDQRQGCVADWFLVLEDDAVLAQPPAGAGATWFCDTGNEVAVASASARRLDGWRGPFDQEGMLAGPWILPPSGSRISRVLNSCRLILAAHAHWETPILLPLFGRLKCPMLFVFRRGDV